MTDHQHTDEHHETMKGDTGTALATRPPDAAPVGLFGTADPAQTIERAVAVAEVLTDVINSRGLYADMGRGRRHVTIEGWQTLGAMMGVTTATEWTRHALDEHDEWSPPRDGQPGKGGWEARVVATRNGNVMGTAEGECRWDESKWRDRDSYAVRSMAQTRAASKAYSAALRFIVTLAGFSGTPAKEMDAISDHDGGTSQPTLDDTGINTDEFKCLACGSAVFDNRATNEQRVADGKNEMPAFKCRNRSCTGKTGDGELVSEGKQGEPWISWHASFFYRRTPAVVAATKAVFECAGDAAFARDLWTDAAASLGFGMYDVPVDRLDDVVALACDMAQPGKPTITRDEYPPADPPTNPPDVIVDERLTDIIDNDPDIVDVSDDDIEYDDDDPERPFE